MLKLNLKYLHGILNFEEYANSTDQYFYIDKFSWGVSDRGASIRVPQDTAKE